MSIEDLQQTPGFRRVRLMMKKYGQSTPEVPTEPTPQERVRMAAVLFEEVMESIWKGLGIELRVYQGVSGSLDAHGCLYHTMNGENTIEFVQTGKFNMVEAIDGALDTIVTARGIMVGCGVADVALEYEVDCNNLEKFGPGCYKDANGKHCKPPNHPKPDIEGLLKKQGWKG